MSSTTRYNVTNNEQGRFTNEELRIKAREYKEWKAKAKEYRNATSLYSSEMNGAQTQRPDKINVLKNQAGGYGTELSWMDRLKRLEIPIVRSRFFPVIAVVLTAIIWTPDRHKINFLLQFDSAYENAINQVHLTYWFYTMESEEYMKLKAQIDNKIKKSDLIPRPNCPL